jgi:hypothetical protein
MVRSEITYCLAVAAVEASSEWPDDEPHDGAFGPKYGFCHLSNKLLGKPDRIATFGVEEHFP